MPLHIQRTQLNALLSCPVFVCRTLTKPQRRVAPLKGTLERNLFFKTLIFIDFMTKSYQIAAAISQCDAMFGNAFSCI